MSNRTTDKRSPVRSLHRRLDRGAGLVEMAVITPVLFMVTLAGFELGRAVWTNHTLSDIATEAARYASVRSKRSDDPATSASVAAFAKTKATGIDVSALVIETTWTPSNERNSTVRVTVSYLFRSATGLLPFKTIQLARDSSRVIVY